jgi:glycerol-3-phosphate cytidylyltransferase
MKVGFTCGAFDLLHAGHVVMLEESASRCDWLIVGLHIDPSVDRQNKNSPVQSVYERFIQLDGLKYVDEIIPYSTETCLMDILLTKKIDVRFVGEDYRDKRFTGDELNIPVAYTNRKHSFSSTSLRDRVKLS